MDQDYEFWKANEHLVATWSDFVKVNLERGETLEGIRKRLSANNLSEKQIDLILDPRSKVQMDSSRKTRNTVFILVGIFKVILGLFFIMVGLSSNYSSSSPILIGVVALGLSFYWFSRVSRS